MPTEIYFELQTRRNDPFAKILTPWDAVHRTTSFIDVLDEYEKHIEAGYEIDRLQIVQITKQSTVIIPEQLLKVTEITKDC